MTLGTDDGETLILLAWDFCFLGLACCPRRLHLGSAALARGLPSSPTSQSGKLRPSA